MTTTITLAIECGHSYETFEGSSTFDFPEEAVFCQECKGLRHIITEENMGLWSMTEDGLLVSALDPTTGYEGA